jgi:hypothetical protein
MRYGKKMFARTGKLRFALYFTLSIAAMGCGGEKSKKLVSDVVVADKAASPFRETAPGSVAARADEKSGALQIAPASSAIKAEVTFDKEMLFSQEFLYGFDLQYSSGADADYALIQQSTAFTHIPCFFRQLGDELQLLADQKRLFESNINAPEILIGTYKIVAEDEKTVTVQYASGGLVINQTVNGKSAPLPKQSWLRSIEFVAEGNYLLQETGMLLADGSVQTFMEAVFPRSNLVPKDYKGLEAMGAFEPLAERYRFLEAEKVFVEKSSDNGVPVRKQTAFATRFHLAKEGATIDWYVTPNLPDSMLPVIKSGVEGWNRYFNPMFGYDVMVFKGKLPTGVKLGDPRYNVINFDSVAEAGAAYESQAADPLTGIQSHSLVYMPYAWYNIGAKLWEKRVDLKLRSSEEIQSRLEPKGSSLLYGHDHKIIKCVRALEDAAMPVELMLEAGEGGAASKNVDDFARRLMVATLFHEIGHGLGLAHNFKGSLAYDNTRPIAADNVTSWSVMDYNYFQLDSHLMDEIGGFSGMVMEYDRQMISQLYHGGKEVKSTDAVIPACEDSEADSVAGGVDPTCLRYDSTKNPADAVRDALHNIVAEEGPHSFENRTLTQAINAFAAEAVGTFSSKEKMKSSKEVTAALALTAKKVTALMGYYVNSGAQSLKGNLKAAGGKPYRIWSGKGGIADEAAFRSAYRDVTQTVLDMRALPPAPLTALHKLAARIGGALAANTGLGTDEAARLTLGKESEAAFNKLINKSTAALLSDVRTGIYSGFEFSLENPFTLTLKSDGDAPSNFENFAAEALAKGVVMGLDDENIDLYDAERLAAAKVLLTFKGGSDKYDLSVAALKYEINKGVQAGKTQKVNAARKALKVLAP